MKTLAAFLCFSLWVWSAFAQTCPTISRDGNTLRVAEPTGGVYQWFLNGTPIVGATGETYSPAVDGDYTVEVYGTSDAFSVQPPLPTTVDVTVSGLALDRLLQPVENVTVSFDGLTTQSDAQGRFSFPTRTVNAGRITLKYEKAGYFAAGQGLNAYQNGEMKTVVCLVDKGNAISFVADSGLVATTKAAKIEIPKLNGIQTASGQIYHGEVKAYIAAFNPDDPMFGETMPGGDFMGKNGLNETVALQSIGILTVEMTDSLGNPLNLAKPAVLSFRPPKMYKDLAATQTSIPLWHFDETAQIWKEEGVSTKNGAWFKGEVSHFSWWNCDMPNTFAYVKGCLTNVCSGNAVGFVPIYFNERTIYTDSAGCFFTDIPANQSFNVSTDNTVQTITTPTANDTLEILGIQSVLSLFGYGHAYYDNSILTVKVVVGSLDMTLLSGLTYSLDGQNFQSSNLFANLTVIPNSVWVRSGSCDKKIAVYFTNSNAVCVLLSQNNLSVQPNYATFFSALQAQTSGAMVYKLQLNSNPNEANLFLQNLEACPCLQSLALTSNNLTSIPAEIENLTQLQYLYLNYNQLTSLPPQIGNLAQLQNLSLSYNKLASLPTEIGNLTQLKELLLKYNYLASVSTEIGKLTQLQNLNLQNNELTSLPTEIGNLIQLNELLLGNNQLTSLPAQIGNLTQLRRFLIENNQLTSLPAEIWNLIQLQTFSLTTNQLTSIPAEIGNLAQLLYLYLNNNQITSVPTEIGNLTLLQSLELSNNQLTTLPAEIGNLPQLLDLYLNNNQITSVPTEIGNLTLLQSLELSNNQLTTLPAEIGNLPQLLYLYLNNNQITSVPTEIGNLTSLKTLDLFNNQLTTLPASICDLKDTLTTFKVNNNPGSTAMQAQWNACP